MANEKIVKIADAKLLQGYLLNIKTHIKVSFAPSLMLLNHSKGINTLGVEHITDNNNCSFTIKENSILSLISLLEGGVCAEIYICEDSIFFSVEKSDGWIDEHLVDGEIITI